MIKILFWYHQYSQSTTKRGLQWRISLDTDQRTALGTIESTTAITSQVLESISSQLANKEQTKTPSPDNQRTEKEMQI